MYNFDNDMIVINISDGAIDHQNNTPANAAGKLALSEKYFDKVLAKLSNRPNNDTYPECEVTHKLDHFNCEGFECYTLSNDNYENVVLYIHGGGWGMELSHEHVEFCDRLVDALNAKVYMPLYPLAPQYTATDSYKVIESAYKEVLKENKKIYLMGDSAGGNIALGLQYTIKQEHLPNPTKMILLAPCPDMSFTNPEIAKVNETDIILDVYGSLKMAEYWAGKDHLKDPKNSALYADVTGYPDTLIIQGTNDILYPDNLLLFEHLKKANVKTTFVKAIGLWHVYAVDPIPEREDTVELIKEYCFK